MTETSTTHSQTHGLLAPLNTIRAALLAMPLADRLAVFMLAFCYQVYAALIVVANTPLNGLRDKQIVFTLSCTIAAVIGVAMVAPVLLIARRRPDEARTLLHALLGWNALYAVFGLFFVFASNAYLPLVNGLFGCFAVANAILVISVWAGRSVWLRGALVALSILTILTSIAMWFTSADPAALDPEGQALALVAALSFVIMPPLFYGRALTIIPISISVFLLALVIATGELRLPLWLVAGAVVIALILARGFNLAGAATPKRVTPWLDGAVVLWIILITVNLRFPGELHHTNIYVAPINDVLHGKTILVDTYAQYGTGVTYLLAVVFGAGIIPFTYPGFSLMISGLLVIQFAMLYFLYRVTLRSQGLAIAALTVTMIINVVLYTISPQESPATGPLRFFPVFALVLVVALRAWKPGWNRRLLTLEWFVLLAGALWAIDTMVYVLLIYAATSVFEVYTEAPSVRAWLWKSIKRFAAAGGAVIVAVAAVAIVTKVRSGEFPNFSILFDGLPSLMAAWVYKTNPFFWSPWVLMVAIYCASLMLLVFKAAIIHQKSELVRYLPVAAMTAAGFSTFVYFVGNPFSPTAQVIPAIYVAAFWYSEIESSAHDVGFLRWTRVMVYLPVLLTLFLAPFGDNAPMIPVGVLVQELGRGFGIAPVFGASTVAERWQGLPAHWYFPRGQRVDSTMIYSETMAILNRAAVGQDRVPLFVHPDVGVEALITTGRTNSLPLSHEVSDSYSASLTQLAVAASGQLGAGDSVILSRDFATLWPNQIAALTSLCSRFDLEPVVSAPSQISTMRLVPQGQNPLVCTCDENGLVCPNITTIPAYQPGDVVAVQTDQPATFIGIAAANPDQDGLLTVDELPRENGIAQMLGAGPGWTIYRQEGDWLGVDDSGLPYRLWVISPEADQQPFQPGASASYALANTLISNFDYMREWIVGEMLYQPQDVSAKVRFGESITLDRWMVGVLESTEGCQSVRLESWWEVRQPVDQIVSMSFAIVGPGGLAGQADGPLAGVDIQSLKPGIIYRDVRTVALGCDISPLEYSLVATVYTLPDVARLPVEVIADGSTSDQLVLETLEIK